MNLMLMLHDLGEDADLLARKDSWLEQQRKATATELDKLANELRAILLAQRIKKRLQQQNMVAVLHDGRDENGDVIGLDVKIKHLPDAIKELESDKHRRLSAAAHITGWAEDGYDTETSRTLRQPS